MLIKDLTGEIHLKIVYFGPGMSGKTTNLQEIHNKVCADSRTKLTTIKTREDRTLFFDFTQIKLGKICGLIPKFNLYTVPGQSYYKATRKLVLEGVDGVVFVADSQTARMPENLESFADLRSFLQQMGESIESIPTVLQCNKQDLTNVLKPEVIKRELGANGLVCYPAAAIKRIGVFETFKEIVTRVAKKIT
ncbi:gliding-motility protein MglA [candidate division KSB1 bacterium]|nr:gliding-motility protein MglA [candidate division KSB1 bacterium]